MTRIMCDVEGCGNNRNGVCTARTVSVSDRECMGKIRRMRMKYSAKELARKADAEARENAERIKRMMFGYMERRAKDG